MNNKILDARNLKISFRTSAGKVQAVRGISFELFRGETLAIVGESGSGKSVTARSMLGILAANAIVEGGEMIYDGQDLLKIAEDDFHKIRGEKISMIFQDPLSSLNPIVKIGKQLTEAMIIKGKSRQKNARKTFNSLLKTINDFTDLATEAENNAQLKAENKLRVRNFDKFQYKHIELESAYSNAKEAVIEALDEIDNLLFEFSRNAFRSVKSKLSDIIKLCRNSLNRYVVFEDKDKLLTLCNQIQMYPAKEIKEQKVDPIIPPLKQLKEILERTKDFIAPNFFAMGYYLTYCSEPLPEMETGELNKFMRKYLDDNFMFEFIEHTRRAVEYSFNRSIEARKIFNEFLQQESKIFDSEILDKEQAFKLQDELAVLAKKSIDPLKIHKDSITYTFGSSLNSRLKMYFNAMRKNAKDALRFEKDIKKYNDKINKGKVLDWKVVPAALVDIEEIKKSIVKLINRIIAFNENAIADAKTFDAYAVTIDIIDYLKQTASMVVHRVTHRMAKLRAIKLMEEVGIPEPRLRYNQYPFQFSGGMRQRIVIAIALAANPEILVCDEPTTALDVTIQAQILELINKLKAERNISVVFITHDLGVVANMADRIAVMYAGKIVECGTAEEVFYNPSHPYTWALLSSMPDLETTEKLDAIPGTPPNMIYPPEGDAFAARNKYAMKIDFEMQPPMFKISDTHSAATWLLHPDAPKVEPPKIVLERIERMRAQAQAQIQAQAKDTQEASAQNDTTIEPSETIAAKKPVKKPAAKKPSEKTSEKVQPEGADKKPATKKPSGKTENER